MLTFVMSFVAISLLCLLARYWDVLKLKLSHIIALNLLFLFTAPLACTAIVPRSRHEWFWIWLAATPWIYIWALVIVAKLILGLSEIFSS